MSNKPLPEHLLTALLDGQLQGAERDRAEKMLRDHPELKNKFDAWQANAESVRGLPQFRLHDGFADQVLAVARARDEANAELERADLAHEGRAGTSQPVLLSSDSSTGGSVQFINPQAAFGVILTLASMLLLTLFVFPHIGQTPNVVIRPGSGSVAVPSVTGRSTGEVDSTASDRLAKGGSSANLASPVNPATTVARKDARESGEPLNPSDTVDANRETNRKADERGAAGLVGNLRPGSVVQEGVPLPFKSSEPPEIVQMKMRNGDGHNLLEGPFRGRSLSIDQVWAISVPSAAEAIEVDAVLRANGLQFQNSRSVRELYAGGSAALRVQGTVAQVRESLQQLCLGTGSTVSLTELSGSGQKQAIVAAEGDSDEARREAVEQWFADSASVSDDSGRAIQLLVVLHFKTDPPPDTVESVNESADSRDGKLLPKQDK